MQDIPVMENPGITINPFAAEGQRIARIRRALGLTQTEISKRLHIKNSRWSNWETGVNQIPPSEATKLKRMFPGLALDWIYEGDESRLTVEAAQRLAAAEATAEETVKKRGRPSRH